MSQTINAVPTDFRSQALSVSSSQDESIRADKKSERHEVSQPNDWGLSNVTEAVDAVGEVFKAVTDVSLSFSIEEDLSRMVVAVRAVGSDEIIRQFPPEEFITVAKHIAALNPDMVDADYLKGVLFDQYT